MSQALSYSTRDSIQFLFQSQQTESRPEGYSWDFLVGVCRPVPQILTLFQTQKSHFPH